MKRCALSLLLACLGLAALLLAASCGEVPWEPQVTSKSWTGHIDARMWTDHQGYEFGDPVTMGVTLTNVTKETMVLQSQSGDTAVVDIEIEAVRNVGDAPIVFQWSKENPDKVQRTITLAPGESYVVTWTIQLPVPAIYHVTGDWTNTLGRFSMVLSIEYGKGFPNP
jgi:hypothetical protein